MNSRSLPEAQSSGAFSQPQRGPMTIDKAVL